MGRDMQGHANFDRSARSAIEALRNGVPNGDAVRALGSNQPNTWRRFSDLLDAVGNTDVPPATSQGMLFSGDFGTGKSHLLSHFEHLALERGFVCSRVPISKETPLFDLGKVYASAMENGRMPGRRGRLVEELARVIDPNSEKYTSRCINGRSTKCERTVCIRYSRQALRSMNAHWIFNLTRIWNPFGQVKKYKFLKFAKD